MNNYKDMVFKIFYRMNTFLLRLIFYCGPNVWEAIFLTGTKLQFTKLYKGLHSATGIYR